MFNTRYSRPLRPALTAAVAAGLALSAAATALAEGVADHIPSDALMVVKVNKLQDVSKKAGNLATAFGIAAQNPDAADPLAALKRDSGISKGIDDSGNFALYVANAHLDEYDPDDDASDPPVVALIPVSDYEAFTGNFQDVQDVGGGVSSATLAEAPDETVYMMKMGDFAAVSVYQDLVKAPAKAIEFKGVTDDRLEKRDAVFYANFQQLGPMLKGQLNKDDNKQNLKQELQQNLQDNPQFAKFAPVADAAVDQLFEAADGFLRDANAAAINLDLSDAGIGFGVVAQFKDGSYLADLFGDVKTTDDSLLAGLPEGNYLLYGGQLADKAFAKKLFDDLLGPVVTKLKDVPDSDNLVEYVETAKGALTAAGDARFALFSPTGQLGAAPLVQRILIQDGDAKQLMQAQQKMVELTPKIAQNLAGDNADNAALAEAMDVTYTPDAKTVDGVTFDKYAAGTPQGQGMDPQVMISNYLFGPEGPTSYLGEVDGKLLTVSGLGEDQIGRVVESIKAGKAPLAQVRGVKSISDKLPGNRSAVVYFQPDELVRSAVNYAQQMGQNIPVQLPDDLPPVGVAAGPAEDAIAIDGFVSKDLIQALVAASLQVQQQFQNGGPGGGL